jgi:uncharacterized surface protein with fasciclin (FAS1) repeats
MKIRLPSLLSTAALIGACATTPAPAPVPETAARAPQLTTVTRLINDAGLAETLRGAGPYTLFAPSDEAFKAVPAATMAQLAGDKALLRQVLTYHVLPGKLMAADLSIASVKSVQGANLALGKAGTFVTVEDAVVTQADLTASNGVVHVIDRVLMPPRR